MTTFRDVSAAQALTSALAHPPAPATEEERRREYAGLSARADGKGNTRALAPFPLSHHERDKLDRGITPAYAPRNQFYALPQRLSMRFSEPHFVALEVLKRIPSPLSSRFYQNIFF